MSSSGKSPKSTWVCIENMSRSPRCALLTEARMGSTMTALFGEAAEITESESQP